MKATTFGNLKRNDVFTFNGSKTQWKVTSIKVSEKDGQEYPTHITCSTIGSEVIRTFDLSKKHDYNGTYGATVSDRAVKVIEEGDEYPVKIEDGEWWFKGCFITEQRHPKLLPYHVHQDTEENLTVGVYKTFVTAHFACVKNEVLNPKSRPEDYIGVKN